MSELKLIIGTMMLGLVFVGGASVLLCAKNVAAPAPAVAVKASPRPAQSSSFAPSERADKPIIAPAPIPRAASSAPEALPAVAIEDGPPRFSSQEDYAAHLDATFSMDAPATAGAHAVEGALREAFNGASADGLTVQRLECKARSCRADVTFADHAADMRIMARLFMNDRTAVKIPMDLAIPTRAKRADGTVVATLFFTSGDGEN